MFDDQLEAFRPTFQQNYLVEDPSRITTVTRASGGTAFDSTGTLITYGNNVPRRDFNPVTLQPRGLLIEGARTNLVLNSDTLSTQNVTVTAVAHTLSFYGTGTITLSGASTAGPLVGTGAFPQRVSLTFTPSAGTLTLTVTGSVRFANLEVGPFASSYIPTTGASATRAEDVAIVSSYAALGWNETQGTLVLEAQLTAVGTTNAALATVSDATSANRIQIGLTPAGLLVPRIVNAGTGYNPGVPTAVTPTSVFKAAMAWGIGANQGIAAANGNLGSASTPVALPTSTTMTEGLRIGTQNIGLGAVDASLWIRQLTYYPSRLPNATIQSLTA
jgi:hypothetical protein